MERIDPLRNLIVSWWHNHAWRGSFAATNTTKQNLWQNNGETQNSRPRDHTCHNCRPAPFVSSFGVCQWCVELQNIICGIFVEQVCTLLYKERMNVESYSTLYWRIKDRLIWLLDQLNNNCFVLLRVPNLVNANRASDENNSVGDWLCPLSCGLQTPSNVVCSVQQKRRFVMRGEVSARKRNKAHWQRRQYDGHFIIFQPCTSAKRQQASRLAVGKRFKPPNAIEFSKELL